MSYQFLRDLEEEIFPKPKKELSWIRDYDQLFTTVHVGPLKSWGHAVANIKIRLRAYDELSKWWKTSGLGSCPTDPHVDTWDEHRFVDAYENTRMHQPFDMRMFLAALQSVTGHDLVQFNGIVIPSWKLSPDNEYWDMPSLVMKALREVWHGKNKQGDNWWVSGFGSRFRYHQCHYFIYQPEPELWMFLASEGKPSYAKGRLYAYNKYRDVTVLEEKFLHSLVNLNITKRA